MLRVENLYKRYGDFLALNGLQMHVRKGELFGFVGPNGAGKTTTIRIIVGLLTASSGDVWVAGQRVGKDLKVLKNHIGFVPDFFGLYDNLTVMEYLEFYAAAYQIPAREQKHRALEVLDMVQLSQVEDKCVDALSRGMQQKLCVARALIHKPPLLVMDEPASGLDPRTRREFKELLKQLRQMDYTILISSHILSELADMCTGIGIINQGRMVLQGDIEDIMVSIDSSNPLLITVYKNLEEAVRLVGNHPLVTRVSIQENVISVLFSGTREEEAQLLESLIRAGVMVTSFCREHGSLESVFFTMTEAGKEGEVYETESGFSE